MRVLLITIAVIALMVLAMGCVDNKPSHAAIEAAVAEHIEPNTRYCFLESLDHGHSIACEVAMCGKDITGITVLQVGKPDKIYAEAMGVEVWPVRVRFSTATGNVGYEDLNVAYNNYGELEVTGLWTSVGSRKCQ